MQQRYGDHIEVIYRQRGGEGPVVIDFVVTSGQLTLWHSRISSPKFRRSACTMASRNCWAPATMA
jgi:hypothetical protein